MSNKLHFFRQANPYIINNGDEGGGGGDAFIATFRTTSANESITLPYVSNGTYSGAIDWGDGTVTENSYANRTHTYVNSGDYDITVLGELIGFGFFNSGDKDKIINLKNWGDGFRFINNTNGYFRGCTNLDITATDTPTLDNINTFRLAFRGCPNLIWNETINDWDVSSIRQFDYMFDSGTNNFNQNIGNWVFNQSNTSFFAMFENNKGFDASLNNWNIENVTKISRMFNGSIYDQPLNNWNTENVVSFADLFSSSQFNQPLNNWNTENVVSLSNCFKSSQFNQPLNNWNVEKVTNFSGVFNNNKDFNHPLNNWNTIKATTFNSMFAGSVFNQDISSWDFSKLNATNSLSNLMNNSSYNPAYYDNLLIKWASDTSLGGLQPNIIERVDMGGIKYTANGASARASILANNKAVTINDGGQI